MIRDKNINDFLIFDKGVLVPVLEYINNLIDRNDELEGKLNLIKYLIEKALDPDKTSCEESFENLYKCLNIIDKAKEVNNAR